MHRIIKFTGADGRVQRQPYPAIPIMRRSDLYLTPSDHPHDHRFARIFRGTWKSIPLSSRRRLLRHWREHDLRNKLWGGPEIVLTNGVIFAEQRFQDSIGLCRQWGHELSFFAPIVRRMPDGIVAELIVHELAHACQYAATPTFEVNSIDDDAWEEWAYDIQLD